MKQVRGVAMLEIRLLTGRKHQIRVHLSEKGHPLVGDRKYGKGNDAHATLALHARSLSFTHPVSGKRSTFQTPIPDYFIRLVGSIESPAVALGGVCESTAPDLGADLKQCQLPARLGH